MNRNILIGIVSVIVIAAGAWWYFNHSSASVTSDVAQLPELQQETNGTQQIQTQATQNNPTIVAPQVSTGESAIIEPDSLSFNAGSAMTVIGKATGVSQVYISVNAGTRSSQGQVLFKSDLVPVANGYWSANVSTALQVGSYTLHVYDPNGAPELTSGTLTIVSAPRLLASPMLGAAPLTVAFSGVGVKTAWELDYGDKTTFTGCTGSCNATPFSQTHTYSYPGIYKANLMADGGENWGDANIVVTSDSAKPAVAIDYSSRSSLQRDTSNKGIDTVTFTGEALNVPYVRLYVYGSNGKVAYDSGIVPVTNYHWSVTASAPRDDDEIGVHGYTDAAGKTDLGPLTSQLFYAF